MPGLKAPRTDERRNVKLKRAQDQVIELLAEGHSIAECMRHVGRTYEAWRHWNENSESFKARAAAARERGQRQRNEDLVQPLRQSVIRHTTELDPTSFAGFRKLFFGFDTYAHQQRIVDAFEQAPPGSVTMVLLPPEAGKTTLVEDYICFILAMNPNLRNCVVSEGNDHAKKILGRVKHRMEDDARFVDFHAAYGPFRSVERSRQRTWNNNQIKLLQATLDERDYSLECRGSGSKIYGARWDNGFLDDIQSVGSLNATKTLLGKYKQDWRTRPGKAGRLFITGTRVGDGDFYRQLMLEGLVHDVVKIPALDPDTGESYFPPVFDAEGNRLESETGEPLGWSLDELEARRQQINDDAIWDLVYLQKDRGGARFHFVESELREAFEPRLPGPPHEGYGPVAACDPALGGVAGFTVASMTSEKLAFEDVRMVKGLARNEDIFDIIEELSAKHHPTHWIIEKNNVQAGIARDDRLNALGQRYGFYVIEHQTNVNKWDPIVGLKSMSGDFKRKHITFPGFGAGPELFEPLVQEYLNWRDDVPTRKLKQDGVMSSWFIWLYWRNMRHTFSSTVTVPQRQSLAGFDGARGLPGWS